MTAGRRTVAIAGGVSAMTVVSAVFLVWSWLTGSTVTAAGPTATMDGVTVDVTASEWAPMDHLEDGGFVMPSQMMPGAPDNGEARLGVRVTFSNPTSGARNLSLADDFEITGDALAEPVPLSADTVGEVSRLVPTSALNAVLYFDLALPEDEPPSSLYLKWTSGRDTVLIPVPLPGGDVPVHQH